MKRLNRMGFYLRNVLFSDIQSEYFSQGCQRFNSMSDALGVYLISLFRLKFNRKSLESDFSSVCLTHPVVFVNVYAQWKAERKSKRIEKVLFLFVRFNVPHRCWSKNKRRRRENAPARCCCHSFLMRNIGTNLIIVICVNQRCIDRCCGNLDCFRWFDVGLRIPNFVSKNGIASNRLDFWWIILNDVRIRKNRFVFSYFEIFVHFENVIIRNEFNFRWCIVQSNKTEFSTRCFIQRKITTKQKA